MNFSFTVIKFFLFFLLVTTPITSTLLSSSSIELCERTSSNGSYYEPSNCNKKIVMTLSVDGGTGASESILAWKTGKDTSTNQQLTTTNGEPIRISVKKSKPYFRYPLYYVRNFNAQPKEQTIYTSLFNCHADSFDSSPTCGRAFNYNGVAIPYSEGFCCSCSACELFGFCTNADRGYTRCSIFGDASAAACLTFNSVWYSGYSIGPAETWYEIDIDVQLPSSNSSSSTSSSSTYSLTLGPDRLGAIDNSPNQDIFTARLVGDFSPFRQPYNLESTMLFVPAAPEDSARVQNGNKEWMLIPSSLVTTGGDECNKIGVSYEAFNSQGSRCQVQVGACLRNQIEDYRNEDIKRLSDGLSPVYLASAKGDFVGYSGSTPSSSSRRASSLFSSASSSSSSSKEFHLSNLTDFGNRNPYIVHDFNSSSSSSEQQHQTRRSANIQSSSSTNNNNNLYLAYEVQGIQASVITLVINADKVALSINVAPGKILFVNATYTTLTTNSREGLFKVMWMNTGDIEAQFYIGIDSCSEPSMRVLAESTTAKPRIIQYNNFRVTASVAGVYFCNITLQNAAYKIVDSHRFTFVVNETEFSDGAQGGTGNGANGDGSNGAPDTRDNSCSSCQFYNPICFIVKSCFWQFSLSGLGGLLLAGIIIFLLYYYFCVIKKNKKKSCFEFSSDDDSDDDSDDEDEKERKKRQKEKEKRRRKREEEKEKKKKKKEKEKKKQQREEIKNEKKKDKKHRTNKKIKMENTVDDDEDNDDCQLPYQFSSSSTSIVSTPFSSIHSTPFSSFRGTPQNNRLMMNDNNNKNTPQHHHHQQRYYYHQQQQEPISVNEDDDEEFDDHYYDDDDEEEEQVHYDYV